MAAILRSSVIQTVCHALSREGTLSVRALHTRRNNPMAYASCAKQNLKPVEVDPLSKKIDDDATKKSVIGNIQRLVGQLKLSKRQVEEAKAYLFLMSAAGAFALGNEIGKNQSLARKCQSSNGKKARRASNGKKARRVDDLR